MANKQTKVFTTLAVILFFSGAFSLIYQIAWVRFLTLLLGSTTMGITTVVATFMSGLAIGSWLASKFLIRRENPLKTYALIELIIAISAIISPLLFGFAFSAMPDILSKFGSGSANIFVLRIIFSAVIMLIPTACMGAALPVLGKYLQEHTVLAERRISIIYGFNTIGACAGCIASGYFLLRQTGLINTIYFTASANALLPVFILLLPKFPVNDDAKNVSRQSSRGIPESHLTGVKTILFISAAVGFVGLASELVWTRLIVLTVGGSIYAFSTILAVYLLFYGIGAAVGGWSLKKISSGYGEKVFEVSRSVLFSILMLIALATTLSISVANILPDHFIKNFSADQSSTLYGMFRAQLFPAMMLMGAATFFSGAFFSYGLFLMKQTTDDPAANTSYFYAWNTVGSIAGSVTAAFLLIPYLGLDKTLRVTSTLLIITVIAAALYKMKKKDFRIHISGAVCLLIIWFIIPPIHKGAITSGAGINTHKIKRHPDVLRYGVGPIYDREMEIDYYREGFTSTITVTRNKYNGELALKTNGKGDGSSYTDMPTQKLLGHFTALFHPDPEKACVIGFGTGTTVGSVALHPHIEVDAVEIEPAVIEAAMLFSEFNNDPLSRDNVKLHLTDGRLHLQRNPGKYDVILSEPSNPWLAGVSDLFTLEFYELGKSALTEDGVFGQWIHMYSLEPVALKLVFRSFQKVFPNAYMVAVEPGSDLLLIGVKGDAKPDLEDMKRRISVPAIAADIAAAPVNINSVYELFSRLIFGPDQTRAFAGDGPVNTDIKPILSYMAPLSLFDERSDLENTKNIIKNWISNIGILDWNKDEEEMKILKHTQEDYLRRSFLK